MFPGRCKARSVSSNNFVATSFNSTSRSSAAHVAFDHGNRVGHYIVVAPFVHDVATLVEPCVCSGSEMEVRQAKRQAKLGECWVGLRSQVIGRP